MCFSYSYTEKILSYDKGDISTNLGRFPKYFSENKQISVQLKFFIGTYIVYWYVPFLTLI